MLGQARAFADQLRAAEPLARGLLAGHPPFSAIVFCGLGGSAAGARLAVGLLEDRLRVPVAIAATAALPGWVGPGTLVVVTSYSGETAEAIAWYNAAGARGASRVALTAGGTLALLAREAGEPLVIVEGGYQPRGALGLLLAPLLVVLEEAGAITAVGDVIAAGAAAVEETFADRLDDARAAAGRLAGRAIVLYGGAVRATVAVRLKNQLNENAKVAAFAGSVPEVAHNEILGWLQARRLALPIAAVFLRDADEEPPVAALTDRLAALVASDGVPVERWSGSGPTAIARAFSLLAFGDIVSCLVAEIDGVDPFDIRRLTDLKGALAAPTTTV
jgi:glucose/mannose-6-phosphate isomerase